MERDEGKLRGLYAGLEVVIAFASAAIFLYSCLSIRTDPKDQFGKISGLAALGLRFTFFAIAVVVALIIAARWKKGIAFDRVTRFGCAVLAGALGGMCAGGIAIALYKTPFGLNGMLGDSEVLSLWADGIKEGFPFSPFYPPGQPYLVAWLSELFGIHTAYAIKYFEILGIGLIAPATYCAWRLVLRPMWALGIGVVAVLALIEAYRPYPMLVLGVFIPVTIRFLQILRHADERSPLQLLRAAVLFGLGYGALFLLYSGWFMWSMPGLVVAGLVLFPWKRAPKAGALFVIVTGVVFALLCGRYLVGFLSAPPLKDDFFYFDAIVDPAYVAMWRGGLPGVVDDLKIWPPLGELGGVGTFSLILVAGAGLSVAYARSRTFVISIGTILVGAWLLRFWYARQMWKTQLVQLWPRTTAEIFYGLALLAGYGVYSVLARQPADDAARNQSKVIGATVALSILFAMAGSHITQRYLPTDDLTAQSGLAWRAQLTPPLDGNQAAFSTVKASSSIEGDGWSAANVVDGKRHTAYSSVVGGDDREEWVEVHLPSWRTFSKVVIYPAVDAFPTEFTFEVWDSTKWIIRVWRRDYVASGPATFYWGINDTTNLVRVRAKKLGRTDKGERAFRLGEIELYQ